MAADTGVKPVSHVDGAIRSHTDIRGAELVGQIGLILVPLGKFIRPLGAEKVKTLQGKASPIRLGQVAEDHITCRLAREQQTAVVIPQAAVLIKTNPGG